MIHRPKHNRYIRTRLTGRLLSLPTPAASSASLAEDMIGKFSLSWFKNPGQPQAIERVPLPRDVPNVLRIPIKRPGTAYRLPSELAPLLPLVELAASAEAAASNTAGAAHVHITFDRRFVIAGSSHRMPGFHVDGFQGAHKAPKPVEHSYIVCDREPTQFSDSGYDLGHLRSWEHAFAALDTMIAPGSLYELNELTIYRMSAYQVHRTPKVRRSGWRTFCRITFAHEELEDNRNTINPHFDGQRYLCRGDLRDTLTAPK